MDIEEKKMHKPDSVAKLGKYLFMFILILSGFVLGNATARREEAHKSDLDDISVNVVVDSANADGEQAELQDEDFDFDVFWEVYSQIKNEYLRQPVDDQAMYYGAIKGLVYSLGDPHSAFFVPEEAKSFEEEMAGSFEGIGAQIGIKKNRLIIIAPLPNSPAEQAGVRAGDQIFMIDDVETTNISLEYAVSIIRGEQGSDVKLTILRSGEDDFLEITIKRARIEIKSATWEMKQGDIAYITLSHFNEDSEDNFAKVAKEVVKKNSKGIILNLRNNPGGLMPVAIEIAGHWVGNKVVVKQRWQEDELIDSLSASGKGEFAGIPTVVLINGGSASASEIVAGALQDYGLATLVGETTFGKGTVQDYQTLEDGSALKLTISEWLTPNGRSIDEVGITPDLEVELTNEDFDNDLDPQLDKALELL